MKDRPTYGVALLHCFNKLRSVMCIRTKTHISSYRVMKKDRRMTTCGELIDSLAYGHYEVDNGLLRDTYPAHAGQ